MKLCPRCQSANAPDNRFCQQCGQAFPKPGAAPSDATVLYTATQAGPRVARQQTFSVSALFGSKSRAVIGRAPDCDVCLPHPTVSRYHALVERRDDGLWLLDLGSVNGVFVGGRRIVESNGAPVREGDRVGIGPFLLTLAGGVIESLDNSRSLRLEARRLEKVVWLPGGGSRKLLDDVNLVVNPGEFVSLLGPSGSGKSTLMDCLNGRRPATGGVVLANGEDFYRHFDNFRQSLGYVPQKDIVHTQLSVYRALYYTAKLRLPLDTGPEELRARVEAVIAQMELTAHRGTLVGDLSGGQIKRVSLGAELLAEPAFLYIDEATSGLDAGTEARMMRLFRRLADEGRGIVCITHNVDNVEQCHLALVLARGKLVYYGPPGEAPGYFKVAKISDIYDRISERDPAEWARDFAGSALYREYVADRLTAGESTPTLARPGSRPAAPEATPAPAEHAPVVPRLLQGLLAERRKLMARGEELADRFRALTARGLRFRELFAPVREAWHQFRVLTTRYVELIAGDRRGLRLLLLQAPIVAVFLLVGFVNKDFTQPMPLLRELKAEERRMLTALRALDQLVDSDARLTPEQQKALRKVRVKGEVGGLPATVDATQLLRLLQRVQRDELPADQRKALEGARFTVDVDGEPVEVTGEEMLRAWRQFHESRIPEQLLKVSGPVVPTGTGVNPRFTYILLFILTMIVMWFGCNNAAKEIVKEEAIYARERAVNLRILPYLASKFLVLSAITALHALILLGVVFGTLEVLAWLLPGHTTPPLEHMLAYPPQFAVMVLLAMTGVALGLLLSACVSTPDRANALLPYVLIPQMILGGGIISVSAGLLHYLAITLSPVYWAFRAVHLGAAQLPRGFPLRVNYEDGLWLPCRALILQTVLLLLLTAWFMRRKDAT
jgi:ABC-type multidrug transport system ATPase subunit